MYKLNADHTTELCSIYEYLRTPAQDRRVALTDVGSSKVSTVFLALDHAHIGGPPILFETMIRVDDVFSDFQERYTTWDEAVAGHARAVAALEQGLTL